MYAFFSETVSSVCEEPNGRKAMQVFREPVITPSGLSYEQSALQEHLSKVSAPLLLSTPVLTWVHHCEGQSCLTCASMEP